MWTYYFTFLKLLWKSRFFLNRFMETFRNSYDHLVDLVNCKISIWLQSKREWTFDLRIYYQYNHDEKSSGGTNKC